MPSTLGLNLPILPVYILANHPSIALCRSKADRTTRQSYYELPPSSKCMRHQATTQLIPAPYSPGSVPWERVGNFITHICAYCRIISVLCVFRFLMTFINGLNIFTLSIRLRTSGVKCVNAWWSEQDTNCVIPIFTFRCWFGNSTHMRKVFAPFGWYP